MPHSTGIYDTDLHFVIDPITRTIRNDSGKVTIIQYDHNSERFTFEVPRYIDGHDMSECNRVEVHYNNIASGSTNRGLYEVTDLQVSPEDDRYVICSWLISQNATRLVGRLVFIIRFACITTYDGEVSDSDYAWNTAPYSDVKIVSGIDNADCIVEGYADIIEQWKHELLDAGVIDRIEQTVVASGDNEINEWTVYMKSGDEHKFEVRNGSRGERGYSAYELAVQHGYKGTEAEWNAAVNEARIASETAAANAKVSETNAATSESNAKQSETSAANSEVSAREDATLAKNSASVASTSESNAKASELAAKQSETNAGNFANSAEVSAENSANSATNAAASEQNAQISKEVATNSATNAAESAAIAESASKLAVSSARDAQANADNLNTDLIHARMDLKADGLYFDPTDKLLYLTSDGEILGDGVAITAFYDKDSEYTITLDNLMDNNSLSVSSEDQVVLEFSYSSINSEGTNDGSAAGLVYVNKTERESITVTQGVNAIDVTNYLISGINTVEFIVQNSEGNRKSLTYVINTHVGTVSDWVTMEDVDAMFAGTYN